MSLEQLIEKLIVSLDKNTAAHTATAAKAAAPAAAAAAAPVKAAATVTPIKAGITVQPAEQAPAGIDFDVLKVAAGKVAAALGKPATKKIITDVGQAKDLATVKPNRYYLLIDAFEKALGPKEETAGDDDDDDSL